jgi:putative hydrolase of the HAD superfamily
MNGDGAAVAPGPIRAVLFDLGGVVLESPFPAIRAVEDELGCEPGFVAAVVDYSAGEGAFAELERGEIDMDEFDRRFRAETAALGCEVPGAELLARIRASIPPRPRMLAAVAGLRAHGYLAGAVTNTWKGPDGWDDLAARFDVYVDSSVEGIRKPDPAIYLEACRRLDVSPAECVFLDDMGGNLKPARRLGMRTILVTDPDAALDELSALVGVAV